MSAWPPDQRARNTQIKSHLLDGIFPSLPLPVPAEKEQCLPPSRMHSACDTEHSLLHAGAPWGGALAQEMQFFPTSSSAVQYWTGPEKDVQKAWFRRCFPVLQRCILLHSEHQSSVRKTTAEFPTLPFIRQVRRHLYTADREEADVSHAKKHMPVKSLFLHWAFRFSVLIILPFSFRFLVFL